MIDIDKSDPGISSNFDIEKFDSHKRYLLLHRIKNNKADVVLNPAVHEKGYRYHNDEWLVRKVLRYIFLDQKENYDAANNLFLKVDVHEIDPVIKKAITDAADSDFYYTNEKEY